MHFWKCWSLNQSTFIAVGPSQRNMAPPQASLSPIRHTIFQSGTTVCMLICYKKKVGMETKPQKMTGWDAMEEGRTSRTHVRNWHFFFFFKPPSVSSLSVTSLSISLDRWSQRNQRVRHVEREPPSNAWWLYTWTWKSLCRLYHVAENLQSVPTNRSLLIILIQWLWSSNRLESVLQLYEHGSCF